MKLRRFRRFSPFGSLYAQVQADGVTRRSMFFQLLSNVFGNMFCVVCASGTTAMIQLANFLGAGDFEYGVITAIPLAAAVFQIPFSILVSRTHKRKKYLLTVGLFSRVLWLLFGLVPFILPVDPKWLRLWTIIILLGISSVGGSMINVCWMPWMADLIPIQIRGRWMSRRDAINAVFGVLFGLAVSFILDRVPGEIRYTIVFSLGALFGILDMLCYAFMKEVYSTPPTKMNITQSIGAVLRDRRFMRFSLFWTAWCFTANMAGMYISRYALNEMGLSNMQVTLFGSITASAVTMLVVSQWGKLLDRYGCKPVMLTAGICASFGQAFILLSRPGSILPMLLYNLIGAIFWSATNLAAAGMQLSYSPDDKRPSYIAFFSCSNSLFGSFLGVLLGGAALDWMEAAGIPGNTGFDRYKILVLASVILRLLTVILLVPKMENDRPTTTREMFADLRARMRMRRIHRKIF